MDLKEHTGAAMKQLGIEHDPESGARIRYGANTWTPSYSDHSLARMRAHGLTEDEIAEAIALYDAEWAEHIGWVAYYGRPEYGGWVRDKRDNRHKPHRLVPEEYQG